MALYVADADFFIQAHRATYPLDVATSFWQKIQQFSEKGILISIDKVKDEIYRNNDTLKKWIDENLAVSFFDHTPLPNNYKRVIQWAVSKSNYYLKKAIDEFSDSGISDAFLVAFCLQNPSQHILVTQEVSQSNRISKIKIPDACLALNISYKNTIEMFRDLGATF